MQPDIQRCQPRRAALSAELLDGTPEHLDCDACTTMLTRRHPTGEDGPVSGPSDQDAFIAEDESTDRDVATPGLKTLTQGRLVRKPCLRSTAGGSHGVAKGDLGMQGGGGQAVARSTR